MLLVDAGNDGAVEAPAVDVYPLFVQDKAGTYVRFVPSRMKLVDMLLAESPGYTVHELN
jgi:hypothetical protein